MASLQTTRRSLLLVLAFLWCAITPALADGRGQIGMGSKLYKPLCGHSCRKVIANSKLLCDSRMPGSTPLPSSDEDHSGHVMKRHVHAAALNTAECYLMDAAFLRTFALCLERVCARDGERASVVEWYWEGHVGHSKSIGDWSPGMKPSLTYGEALAAAKVDVREMEERGEEVPFAVLKEPLNVTSYVRDEDLMPIHGSLAWFEQIQSEMTWNSVGIAISSVFIPVLLSMFRFLPGRSLWYSRLVASLERPLIGHRHRTPIVSDLGYMPTRGQSLYLLYLIVTQVFLCVFPLTRAGRDDNTFAPTRQREIIMIIGDRAGVIGTANFLALFLFSARNNVLLWITDWSHGTFLLLHRWIGYATILQVVVHSIVLLLPVVLWGDHTEESALPYWIWGIVGTLVFVLMWPLSLLPLRKRMYEVFLGTHQVLAVLALVGTFMHLYELYGVDSWGYEYWVYMGAGLWFIDRTIRVLRVVGNGVRRAVVTPVGAAEGSDETEYVRIDVEGVVADGHVYVYFPTLSWRVWECHPFSVISSFTGSSPTASGKDAGSSDGDEKDSVSSASTDNTTIRPRMTLFLRLQKGATGLLARRLLTASSGRLSLPVLVESSYHSNPSARSDLTRCSTLLAFAGGVGITGVLPLVKTFGGAKARVCWGVRDANLIRAVEPEFLGELKGREGLKVDTRVGERFDVRNVIREELEGKDGVEGELGVLVCGPPGMADDVRAAVSEYGSRSGRTVVLIDEAFAW